MLVDVVINQQPFYFIYIFFSFFLYAVIYICFTIVFWGANGTVSSRPYIYSSIDWSTRTSAASGGILSGVIVVIIVPALGCICWCGPAHGLRTGRWLQLPLQSSPAFLALMTCPSSSTSGCGDHRTPADRGQVLRLCTQDNGASEKEEGSRRSSSSGGC